MAGNENLLNYLETVNMPWGKLFYRIIWNQLPQFQGLDILDYGSGFGITADHLALDNNVTAYEPNSDMPKMYPHNNKFTQIDTIPDGKFDVIVCHNVLEYVPDRMEILKRFCDMIKPDGIISIIKHNHFGRVMQKAVFENAIEEAISLIDGGESHSVSFGKIGYYETDEFKPFLNIEKIMGIRTFFALQQNNDIKLDPQWQDKMFALEIKAAEIKEFIDISCFHHILLKKN